MDLLNKVNNTYLNLILAAVLALIAGVASIYLADAYYAVAPFHYDSAYYLYRSLQIHDIVLSQGRLAALLQVIANDKDFLDILLRILFLPPSLAMLYGHMVIALPLMGLFLFLTLHYTFKRTQLEWLSVCVVSFIFCFPLIFMPYQGIADYWKESVAIWLFGSAIVSWLLSNRLANPYWSFLSGSLLGLLVIERTGLAVYAALLWIPVTLHAIYDRLKNDPWQVALFKISAFVLPACLLCLFVVILQWKLLYNYYFLKGYDYHSVFQIMKVLLWLILHDPSFRFPVLLLGVLALFSYYMRHDKRPSYDILVTLWFLMALPLIIALMRGFYNGFYNSWCIIWIPFLATLVPAQYASARKRFLFVTILSGVSILAMGIQFALSYKHTTTLKKNFAEERVFYDTLTQLFMRDAKPRYFTFLINEDYAIFYDHVKFNRHIDLNELQITGFMSVHDSYYRLQYGEHANSFAFLANHIMQTVENSSPRPWLVAYCTADDVLKSQAFAADGKTIAIPMVLAENTYLAQHPSWRMLKTLKSPFGCVHIYQFLSKKN